MHWTALLAAGQAGGTSNWNWSVFLGAVVGSLIGAGIPAWMTWQGWQWS